MEELVCLVCYNTYYPPGHSCMNNRWVPVVANLNMTIREVKQLLFSGKQVSFPEPSEQINESTSVSTENVNLNQYFYHDSSLSYEAINRNDERTISSHNSTTEGRRNQLNVISSEQGNGVEQGIRSLSSISLLNNNEPGTTDYIMTMRQSFPSSQISTNVSPLDSIGSQFGTEHRNDIVRDSKGRDEPPDRKIWTKYTKKSDGSSLRQYD
ncbi:hypothetical protein AVEN_234682-1 [Araneus ventricosus]|uniref:Uncharacterized protein n=1 Tax=Araneus ventricosus TaxID=182803 RepID=A0A4Y2SV72_ARAVE|nr:hypothetical protein AVEN_234682-1 [Araneus ventricosus]